MSTAPTKSRSSRLIPDRFSGLAGSPRTQFYLEEFLKHWQCLERHREYYSEGAIEDVEGALMRIVAELEQLCSGEDADQVVGCLLRKFDILTGLSQWTDPKTLH